MKELIIRALDNAFEVLEYRTPKTKVKIVEVSISDVSPLEIVNFMKENDIPDNAYFGGKENGYDAYSDICLCYEVYVPTTEKDKLKYCRKHFSTIAFKLVSDILLLNSYKRLGFNSGLLRQFDDTTVYDMYISKDFDRLVSYYSLAFTQV